MNALPPPDPARLLMTAQAEPILENGAAGAFYTESIRELAELDVPFLLAGTYAVSAYTGISRITKDLDIFCKAGDYPRILAYFQEKGRRVEIEDDRWLGKVYGRGCEFFDVIFAASNGTMPVGDPWFERAREVEMFGARVKIVGPTELIWSKCFIQVRRRFDGPDIAHVLLRAHDDVDWKQLLAYMEVHWEVLLAHLINFRWIYPTERHVVPDWLLDELLDRLAKQRQLPIPKMKICRGRMLSREDYEIDVKEWGFADVGGEGEMRLE